jgi:hypothetical protein
MVGRRIANTVRTTSPGRCHYGPLRRTRPNAQFHTYLHQSDASGPSLALIVEKINGTVLRGQDRQRPYQFITRGREHRLLMLGMNGQQARNAFDHHGAGVMIGFANQRNARHRRGYEGRQS